MADDEEEGGFGGLYEDGHWMWDENTEALIFIRSYIYVLIFNVS